MVKKRISLYDREKGEFFSSTKEAAEALGVTERSVYRAISEGKKVKGYKFIKQVYDPKELPTKTQVFNLFCKCYRYVKSITDNLPECDREFTLTTDEFFMELHDYLERQYELEAYKAEKKAKQEEEFKHCPRLDEMLG